MCGHMGSYFWSLKQPTHTPSTMVYPQMRGVKLTLPFLIAVRTRRHNKRRQCLQDGYYIRRQRNRVRNEERLERDRSTSEGTYLYRMALLFAHFYLY